MSSWTKATAPPPSRGVLRPELQDAHVVRGLVDVAPGLASWVEHYWSVAWDLPGPAFRAEVVSHPSVHVTVESGTEPRYGVAMPAGLVHGVVTRRFSVDLTGAGRVFGVKFHPGGFGAFTGEDVGAWTDRVLPLRAAFAGEAAAVTREVLAQDDDHDRAAVMDAVLLGRLPAHDERYETVRAVVEAIRTDAALTSVDRVARAHGLSERTLQRLFRRYVGVGPKWVLQRYRLHDAVERIDTGRYDDLASLAVELGWFDQAHFTRDFTALVGQPPASYAARAVPPA